MHAVLCNLTGVCYPQPNKQIAEMVAEAHGNCEVVEWEKPHVIEAMAQRLAGAQGRWAFYEYPYSEFDRARYRDEANELLHIANDMIRGLPVR